jgi:hypothetical protein
MTAYCRKTVNTKNVPHGKSVPEKLIFYISIIGYKVSGKLIIKHHVMVGGGWSCAKKLPPCNNPRNITNFFLFQKFGTWVSKQTQNSTA